MKNEAFVKIRRNLLTMPLMKRLMGKCPARQVGTYVIILLYLASCDDGVGLFNGYTVHLLATMTGRRADAVREFIVESGMFVVEGEMFYDAEMHRTFSKARQYEEARLVADATQYARNKRNAGARPRKDKDEDKDEKEMGRKPATLAVADSPFETRAGGRRCDSRGLPLPDDAPPQPSLTARWNEAERRWT